jgi:hypothetical protein
MEFNEQQQSAETPHESTLASEHEEIETEIEAAVEEWMFTSACEVISLVPVNPDQALAEVAIAEEAIRGGRRKDSQTVLLSVLPSEDYGDEAITVLTLQRKSCGV